MTGVTADRLVPGTQLGDYHVDGDLAGGWNHEGYRATHVLLPRRARIMVLSAAYADERAAAVAMMREACLVEAMQHPGVPRVFECGVIDRRPWIACELVEGPTLADSIASRPLRVSEVLGLLRDVAEILDHAHRKNIVHRNLRPEVIVRMPGRTFPICITGWSDARIHDAEAELVDVRADVSALGAVAFTALSGSRPSVLTACERCPGAPRALTALIDRMLSPEPAARPTCAEVRVAAIRIAELSEVAIEEEVDDGDIEEVPVELVDISQTPPPVPRRRGWTPALGNAPSTPRIATLGVIDLVRRDKP